MASKEEGIPTNEEAVERLVQGLEETLELDPSSQESQQEDKEEEVFLDASQDPIPDPTPDDFINEEQLKKQELEYSEEDKQRLKEEAENLKLKGNEHFRQAEYKESALKYTDALRTCPTEYAKDRAVLYANRAAAKMKMELNESAIEDCTKAMEYDGDYLKAVMRRAQLNEKAEKLDEALEDYKRVLQLDPSNKEAYNASLRLPHEINERNEKLKTEMIGKLKDLGNVILKPFGLSTNNFQMVQDPNTGGYSINFQQGSS